MDFDVDSASWRNKVKLTWRFLYGFLVAAWNLQIGQIWTALARQSSRGSRPSCSPCSCWPSAPRLVDLRWITLLSFPDDAGEDVEEDTGDGVDDHGGDTDGGDTHAGGVNCGVNDVGDVVDLYELNYFFAIEKLDREVARI